jgi:hypothetical protein
MKPSAISHLFLVIEESGVELKDCQSGFMTLSPVLLQEQPAVVLLLESDLVSWSLAMDERGGHKHLHGLGRRSVILYVQERTELYCSNPALPEPAYLSAPVKWRLPEPFIAQGWEVTIGPEA